MWPDWVSNRDLRLLNQTRYRLRYAARLGIEDNSKILFLSFFLRKHVVIASHKLCFHGEIWLIIPK